MLEDFRLRIFARIVEMGSFTAAAKSLGISQPAVSQNVAELERYAGGLLFDRSRGRAALTERGRLFAEHADAILDSYRKLDGAFRPPDSILLKDVGHAGRKTCILIRDGRFADLDAPPDTPADRVVEADGLAILPALCNSFGSAAAIRPMTAGGITFFSDSSPAPAASLAAADAADIRVAAGIRVSRDSGQGELLSEIVQGLHDPGDGRSPWVVAPVSAVRTRPDQLRRCADFARNRGLRLSIRLGESRREVEDCLREHGTTPARYLDRLGFLGRDVLAIGCVHLDPEEWRILGRRGVTVAHCPLADLRESRGRFPYEEALASGCRIALGTGEADFDLLEAMRIASLLAGKDSGVTPEAIFRWATKNGADFFGLDSGEIAVGKQADAILIDLESPRMQHDHADLVSGWVRSADSSVIRNVLCAGRLLISTAR